MTLKNTSSFQYYLIINHIKTQNAYGIFDFLATPTAISMVVTNCNPGKSLTHWVKLQQISFFRWNIVVLDHTGSIAKKLVFYEFVGDEPLAEDHNKVHLLAHKKPKGVGIVFVV